MELAMNAWNAMIPLDEKNIGSHSYAETVLREESKFNTSIK